MPRAGAPVRADRADKVKAPGGATAAASAASAVAAGAAAVGQVARIDGSTLVVRANDGSEVRVNTAGATITQPAPVAVSALTAGELVIVQGTTNADGTVTATQVTANNAPVGGGAGGGGGGTGPAAAPPTTAGG